MQAEFEPKADQLIAQRCMPLDFARRFVACRVFASLHCKPSYAVSLPVTAYGKGEEFTTTVAVANTLFRFPMHRRNRLQRHR